MDADTRTLFQVQAVRAGMAPLTSERLACLERGEVSIGEWTFRLEHLAEVRENPPIPDAAVWMEAYARAIRPLQ